MKLTENTIVAEIAEAMKEPLTLYVQPVVKRKEWLYSEWAAKEILERYKKGEYEIQKIDRKENYYTCAHAEDAKKPRPTNTNQVEKWDARAMFGKTFNDIGEIIDFETPLYTSDNRARRAIDLLAYNNKKQKVLTILEYKKEGSNESLLRCVLEAFTYKRLVELNKEKFLRDFHKSPHRVSTESDIRAAVFVHKDSTPYNHFHKLEDSAIRELMKVLNVDFYVCPGK